MPVRVVVALLLALETVGIVLVVLLALK